MYYFFPDAYYLINSSQCTLYCIMSVYVYPMYLFYYFQRFRFRYKRRMKILQEMAKLEK